MTLIRGTKPTAVVALIIVTTLAVWSWGNQRHAQAEEDSLAKQILCYINSVSRPPIPRFHVDECSTPEPPPPPPTPLVEDTLLLCSDGVDNDDDLLIDLADPNCSSFNPKLVVVKTVINDNGGTALVFTFPLYIKKGTLATTTVISGATTTVTSGTWFVGEISNSTYARTFGGDCSVSGEVTLLAGDTKTCTITNDDIAPDTDEENPPSDEDTPVDSDDSGNSGNEGGGVGGAGASRGSGGGSKGGLILGAATTSAPIISPVSQESCNMYLTAFIGSKLNNDVEQIRRLQTVLHDFESAPVIVNGVYDVATLVAVNAFQMKYASDILTPWGARQSTGYVYLTTRKKINEIHCRGTRRFELTPQDLTTIEETRIKTQFMARPLGPVAPSAQTTTTTKTAAVREDARETAGRKNLWWRLLDFFRN